jgi:hypothetical protein
MAIVSMWMLMAAAFCGGGANDLLDYLPSGAYWKVKGVEPTLQNMLAELKRPAGADVSKLPALIGKLGAQKFTEREAASAAIRAMGPAVVPGLKTQAERAGDPEVRARLEQLVAELSAGAKAREVRLLMAIRTLGEIKKREALASLRPLAGSKEPFVADYAKAAIAAVEGRKHSRPETAARDLAADPWLLPRYVGAVAQAVMSPAGSGSRIEESLRKMAATPGMAQMMGDPERMQEQLARSMIPVVERIGNVRLGAVTCGLSEEIGNRTGFAIFVARGTYDPAAVKAALVAMGGKCESAGGVEVLSAPEKKPAMRLIMPSARRLVLVIGADEAAIAQPVKDALAALKSGKGGLAGNAPLAALVKAVKPADRPWAVAAISKCYAQAPLLAGFETMKLTGRRREGGTDLEFVARGKDDEKIGAAAEMLKGFRNEAVEGLKREAGRMTFLKPLADLAAGLKFATGPGKLSASGRLEGDASPVMMMALPWMMLGKRDAAPRRAVKVQAAPVAPAKAPEAVPVPARR